MNSQRDLHQALLDLSVVVQQVNQGVEALARGDRQFAAHAVKQASHQLELMTTKLWATTLD